MKNSFLSICALSLLLLGGFVSKASAEWTPLITASTFTGIQTDLGTAAAGILACAAIILGICLLLKAIAR